MARTKKTSTTDTINIKSLPVQAHIGASKYINDDWGAIAFVIPRNQLQLKFADPELRYNCIYFLFGYDQTTEMVYVGQAKKRNNGESVLARLREHDSSTTEKYCDIWEWVVVCTGKEDTWGLDDLNALEHAFYNEIPVESSLNGNNPNSGGADYNAYTDKIKQIKNYITSIGFTIFADTEDTEKIQVTSAVNENTIVEDLQNGLARIPEIVTPHKVVKAMCDMLPNEVWNDQTVFLDPACKGGEYLREIYDRLMDSELLQSKYPDEFERSNHILCKQLYGIALSQVSLERTTKKLRGYDHNLRVIPNYIHKLKGIGLGTKSDGTHKTIKDILNEEFNRDMKIDVVIGNPPYQELDGGGLGANASAMYNKFIDLANKISPTYTTFIIPMRWMYSPNVKGISTEWRVNELKSNKYREIHYWKNPKELFPTLDIKGNIMYFLKSCIENIGCRVINETDGFEECIELYMEPCDTFIDSSIKRDILKKIKEDLKKSNFSLLVSKQVPFGMHSDYIGSISRSSENNIKVYGNQEITYTNIKRVWKNKQWVDKYKLFIQKAFGNGSEREIVPTPILAEPNEACTITYLCVSPCDNIQICVHIQKYMLTKFFSLLLHYRKSTQNANSACYSLIPLQDFTSNSDIDWSKPISDIDQQLYKKYGLTQEEIDYIESTIKPMN